MGHVPAVIPQNEEERLRALHRLDILGSVAEPIFEDIVQLAVMLCGTPIALISLVDEDRQWFKACVGLEVRETHRDEAFCAHAILDPKRVFVVENTLLDPRFSTNPLVTSGPRIRFYAGAPILSSCGQALGTVCVLDSVPRELSRSASEGLAALARQTAALLELRQLNSLKERQHQELRQKIIEALSGDDSAHASLRQKQRIAAIGQLTSGITHDFNNMLQAVSSTLQVIDRKADDELQVRRWASTGLNAVSRGAALVAQLLTLSRPTTVALSTLPAAERIIAMEEMLTRVLGPDVQLKFDVEKSPVEVICDAIQLESAVLNLVINARDAMANEGTIIISARLENIAGDVDLRDGDYLVVRVQDSGPGMHPEVMTKAFDPFFTTKPDGRGTGLGLSQVCAFAQSAGGVARIETQLGVGTTVSLFLKSASGALTSTDSVAWEKESMHASLGVTVLLVEDDAKVRDGMTDLLTNEGYAVLPVASGFAAIGALEHHHPDVIVSDYGMRGLSGCALLRVVRDCRPDVPVIFVTGLGEKDAIRARLEANTVVLSKPVSIECLVSCIETSIAPTGRADSSIAAVSRP